MKKLLLTAVLLLTGIGMAQAWDELRPYNEETGEKGLYLPAQWKSGYNSSTGEYNGGGVYYSLSRKVESENFVIYWDSGYGTTAPNQLSRSDFYYVDLDYMLQEAERFYKLYSETLGFVDPAKSTTMSKYKCAICLLHTTEWSAYGGGYDFVIPALWINPSTCKPIGHTVAHEIGHSFHYMCFSEANNHRDSGSVNTGFHIAVGNGQGIWEQTAQWQAAQAYPSQMFSESMGVFANSHNYAFTHEWHRYQSYWLHYYLCDHYDDMTTVAQVWNTPLTGTTDFNDALIKLKDLSIEDFYKLYFDYACRTATFDYAACASYRNSQVGNFRYACIMLDDHKYQVAMSSVPQATGFNVIPLEVPAAGTEVTTHFTALPVGCDLQTGDPGEYLNGSSVFEASGRTKYNSVSPDARGFRVGYVALLKNGTRQYFSEDKVYGTGTEEVTEDISFTVPDNVDRMWLIVSPALTRYVRHSWDESINGDDMWPYAFQLEGTDLNSRATIYVSPDIDGRKIGDATITYDLYFPAKSGNDHTGVTFTLGGSAAKTLGTAFQLTLSEIASKVVAYSNNGPNDDQIMFYAVDANGNLQQSGSTANGYGHWFAVNGTVSNYGNGYTFSELTLNNMQFSVGQYPGRLHNGENYTIRQALRYKKSNVEEAVVTFIFNIHVTSGTESAELSSVEYDNPGMPEPPKDCIVTVSVEEGGRVTGGGTYKEGETVRVRATNLTGWTFVNWTVGDEVVSDRSSYQFEVEDDIDLVAHFARKNYTVTYMVDGEVYKEVEVEFESVIEPEEAPEKDGLDFVEWEGLPETMPAKNITVTAVYETSTGLASLQAGNTPTVIYDLTGRRVDTHRNEASLQRGIYLVKGKKYLVR